MTNSNVRPKADLAWLQLKGSLRISVRLSKRRFIASPLLIPASLLLACCNIDLRGTKIEDARRIAVNGFCSRTILGCSPSHQNENIAASQFICRHHARRPRRNTRFVSTSHSIRVRSSTTRGRGAFALVSKVCRIFPARLAELRRCSALTKAIPPTRNSATCSSSGRRALTAIKLATKKSQEGFVPIRWPSLVSAHL